jgi:hypothetical protein
MTADKAGFTGGITRVAITLQNIDNQHWFESRSGNRKYFVVKFHK